MAEFSITGWVLLIILAVIGGGMTGLFAGYMYQLGKNRFGHALAFSLNIVFWVVALWALFGLGREDNLFLFYCLLLLFYALGMLFSNFPPTRNQQADAIYEPENRP